MKKLDSKILLNLQHGNKVYRWDSNSFRKLYFVGIMPNHKSTLIFCEGTYLTYLYIDDKGCFSYDWYNGDYDSDFVANLQIKELENKIKFYRERLSNDNNVEDFFNEKFGKVDWDTREYYKDDMINFVEEYLER